MKYLPLVWAGLWRNPLRTLFTVLALVAAFALFGFLQGITAGFDLLTATAREDRLFAFSRYGAPMPIANKRLIEQLPGVRSVTAEAFLNGTIGGDPKRQMFAGMSDESFWGYFTELNVTPAQIADLKAKPNGLILSARTAQLWGTAVGEHLTMRANIAKKDGSRDWEFEVVAVVDRADLPMAYGISSGNYAYLEEERGQGQGTVNQFLVVMDDPKRSAETAEAIDALFINSGAPTISIVDKSAADEGRNNNELLTMVKAIVLSTLFALLLVTGNAMMQTFRERIPELGTLKAIGYSDRGVLFLVLAEAVAQCVVGAAIGLMIARFTASAVKSLLPAGPAGAMFVPWSLVLTGLLLAMAVALISAAVPAFRAGRMKIVDSLAGR